MGILRSICSLQAAQRTLCMYTQALDIPDTAADKTHLLKAVASTATPAQLAHQSRFDAQIDAARFEFADE